MSEPSQQSNQYADYNFCVENELLVAKSIPDQRSTPHDEESIVQRLHDSGYGKHELDTESLETLIKLSESNSAEEIDLEAHIDANFSIDIDEQQLNATLNYNPAFCGADLDPESVLEAIEELGLARDKINIQRIKEILSSEIDISESIVQGQPAINGEDGTIDVIFDADPNTGPRRLGNGQVDHYETHTYITVDIDTVLLRRNPATPGSTGETVFAEPIEATPGVDIEFELNDSVKLSSEDNNVLLAAKSGHPILIPNSVIIDDTLTLDEASLETGNVEFDGSILIKGDVKPNIRIQASGDIFVGGLVENSQLIAGNNVTIESGIISTVTYDEKDPDNFEYSTLIQAENDIQMKYCNSVKAIAGGSIFIENYSMHSHLNATIDVILGVNHGKGILIGGLTEAENTIEANVVGSDAYVATNLSCADTTSIKSDCSKLQKKIQRTQSEVEMLSKLLERIKSSGSPTAVGEVVLNKAKKIHLEMVALKNDQTDYERRLHYFQSKLHPKTPNQIIINGTIYPNVSLLVNDVSNKTSMTRTRCVIRKVNDELDFVQD